MTFRTSLTYLAGIGVLVLAAACSTAQSGAQYGDAIDPNAQKVTLAELVKNPAQYEGKLVVVDGEYGGKCAGDDGDFYFKNKFDMIEADPPTPKVIDELQKGMPVRLYGTVKVRRGTAEPGGPAPEAHVKIAAKGVQVL